MPRLKAHEHPNSKWVKAINKSKSIEFHIKGVRAAAALIWGYTLAGIPKKVSGVISMCNGSTTRTDIEGWIFEYSKKPPTPVVNEKDPLSDLGI
jgi:hypothetical protein